MNKGKIILFCGPSGVGKGSIEKLLFKNKNLKLELSISATTRAPRVGEVDGIDYFFISKNEFISKTKDNDFIEWNQHFDNCYGTLKSEINRIIDKGNNCFIEVETIGANNILNFYKSLNEKVDIVSFFILPPNIDELINRIQKRGTEQESQIVKRLEKAHSEMASQDLFDYKIINNSIEDSAKEITDIILSKG